MALTSTRTRAKTKLPTPAAPIPGQPFSLPPTRPVARSLSQTPTDALSARVAVLEREIEALWSGLEGLGAVVEEMRRQGGEGVA